MKTQRLSLSIDEMRRFTRLNPDEQQQFVDSIDDLMSMPPEESAAIDTSRRDPSLLATVRRRIVRRSRGILRRRQRTATLKNVQNTVPTDTLKATPQETPETASSTPKQITLDGLEPFTIRLGESNTRLVLDLYHACGRLQLYMNKFNSIAGRHPLYNELNRLSDLFLKTMMRYLRPLYREAESAKQQSREFRDKITPVACIDLAERYPGMRDSVSALTAAYRYM